MVRTVGVFAGVLCRLACAAPLPAQEVQTPERAIPNQYIVVLDDQQVTSNEVPGLAQAFARQHSGRVRFVYQDALRGFALDVSARAAAAIARNPRVRYVEQDAVMEIVATQSGATWGLDRIDQRALPLNGTYVYNTTASGVHAYIIDTGIRGGPIRSSAGVCQRATRPDG